MTTITTPYGQKISLEVVETGQYVVTLQGDDGKVLAQIGMEPHDYYTLIDGVNRIGDAR